MSERLTISSPPLIEELEGRVRYLEFGAVPVAKTEDFRHLQMDFHDIIDMFPSAGDYQGYPNVSSSVYLRRAGEPEDTPRFRLITDPSGNMDRINNRQRNPTIAIRFDQGQKHEAYPAKGEIGSWLMEVTIVGGEGVSASAIGSQKTGRRSRRPLPGTPPGKRLVAKKELLDWIKNQIGEPEDLVPAPTEAELKGARFLGGIGLRRPRHK